MEKDDWVICLDSNFCVSTWGRVTGISKSGAVYIRYYGPIWDSDLWDVKYLLLKSSKEAAKDFFEKKCGKYHPNVKAENGVQARINANKEREKKGLPLFG